MVPGSTVHISNFFKGALGEVLFKKRVLLWKLLRLLPHLLSDLFFLFLRERR